MRDRGDLVKPRQINGETFVLAPAFADAEPVGDEWERPVFERFRDVVGPGSMVFDVGASFGLFSISAARAGARVFAFEAVPETAEALRTHLAWNAVARRVDVVQAAVCDRPGEEELSEHETPFLASLAEPSSRTRRVPALTLDGFCAQRGVEPDVVKIDVEGAEARVLAGAAGIVARRRALFFVEVHERFIASARALAPLEGWVCEEIHCEPAGTRHYFCRPPTA
jgi:FkbM family methyltransferase